MNSIFCVQRMDKLEFPSGFKDPFELSESLSDLSSGSGRIDWSSMESIPLQTEHFGPRSSPIPIRSMPRRNPSYQIDFPDIVQVHQTTGPRIRPEIRSYSLPIESNQNRNEVIDIVENEENNQLSNHKPDRTYTLVLAICLIIVIVYWLLSTTKSTRN